MNITINIAGALMFCALLVVAVAVIGYSAWGIGYARDMSVRYREELMDRGYQRALHDVCACLYAEGHETVGGNQTTLTARGVAYWIKRRTWKEIEQDVNRRTNPASEDRRDEP